MSEPGPAVLATASTVIGPRDPLRLLVSARLEQLVRGPAALVITWPLVLLTAISAALGWWIPALILGALLLAWLVRAGWLGRRLWLSVRQADSVGTREQLDVCADGLVFRLDDAHERIGWTALRSVRRFGAALIVVTGTAPQPRTVYWPARLLPRSSRALVRARLRAARAAERPGAGP